MERLRSAFVENRMWDYCVIWKLGDDPSKFIEWGACCCSGGSGEGEDITIISSDEICRDSLIKHKVTSEACKALARLPYHIPLYSGIHGDVVISRQPSWVLHGAAASSEFKGTQVLVPVDSGLIELFSTKQVPKDQKTIDYISSSFKISIEQEYMAEEIYNNFNLSEQIPDQYSTDYLRPSLPPLIQPLNSFPPISLTTNHSSFEGSSTCSSLSHENQSLKIEEHDHVLGSTSLEKSSRKAEDLPRNILKLKRNRDTDSEMRCGYEEASKEVKQKPEKGLYKSKNLMTERNRRQRIKDGMLTLRSVVPNISKMDRTATLTDAIAYIKEMEETVENYHEELRKMEEEECIEIIAKTVGTKSKNDCKETNQSSASETTPTEVQIEVSKIGTKDFLLKLVCKKRQGGFSRLMKAMNLLGLQVKHVNYSALHDSVMNILTVEANKVELEAKTLKSSLLKLVVDQRSDEA